MAVKPVLASSLIALEEIGLYEERARERLRVGSGCAAVDDALSGGVVYGQDGIYNISGATGDQAAETISLHLLISHLLASSTHTATLIDATGNLDVLKLYRNLITRLSTRNNDHEANVKQATLTLDRVKIMRVFDFEGVVEGLNELVDELEEKDLPRGTVMDSQEDAEEILDLSVQAKTEKKQQTTRQKAEAGMILINNLSQVLGLLLKNNYVQGQASITTLVRRLRNMAQQHNLCVVLLSWSVTYNSDQERASIFEAIKARPGLGKSLGYLVDTQILVDAVPRRARSQGNNSDMVNVIEVVHSRGSHQAGKFGIFDVTGDGELKAVV
ncbi:hypothetical protein AUEXF2481DRAFT_7756 [Aureobasidium subglaciale EXF-2481]|uniref:DNA recombination and repair protein Rad51-like C-terminal domain-containing protein n=1 Tax=Aureobasidium subglaciale (strain EXF-2481) TaxID=1043005 RepID=A0A074Y3S5_AURSE|nr:uncharacterized protein AUEXF2481DRAFT_7756 [Aureobasidium subglaciale EXF-2481]KAI5202180.1 hypothetical protein E4T38_05700 [Aureobasidium subglaciale]KAI5221140.1 hypothetical protein E4T40_05662 [Aureobasidium subglaciale]KAI5224384.1 hypothetical protein E4T41_05679 [Aureobasidium subglaciale]KAI5261045.1 hypothetical protein E4T46_05454 [Aureobasidium subglaciale]KEQ92360.1 hypothetical protein AUEXF2481DRAFT_7756 [Aureobasidium subglaciale EXF-2481]